MRSCQPDPYWKPPHLPPAQPLPLLLPPLKARSVTLHSSAWRTIRKYVKCARKHTGVCCEGFERLPVSAARRGREESGVQQLTRRELWLSAGGRGGGEEINSDWIYAFIFFYFIFCLLAASCGWRKSGAVWLKDARGPIGLDYYGITGLIIGTIIGQKSADALEWREHKRLSWRGSSSVVSPLLFIPLFCGMERGWMCSTDGCNSVPHREGGRKVHVLWTVTIRQGGQCCILNGRVSVCCSLGVDVAYEGNALFVSRAVCNLHRADSKWFNLGCGWNTL